jgi:hypothetical protein
MNTSQEPGAPPAPARGSVRRIAAVAIVSGMIFMLLWFFVFSAFTSLLVASAFCVVVVVASAAFDPLEMVMDAIAGIVFIVLGVIAAVFAAIFSLFSW